jgi:hypothetical protein
VFVAAVFHPILPEKHCGVYVETVAEAIMQHSEHVLALRERADKEAEGQDAAAAPVAQHPFAKPTNRVFLNDEIRALKVARL